MFFLRKRKPEQRIVLRATELIKTPTTGQRPKKILIVDDDPVILKTLTFILKASGYDVVTATNGGGAISQMRDEQPDMLLVDVCLPLDAAAGCGASGWDGFQIARWVRHLSRRARAIMMSGADKSEYREKASAAGADAFLAKPINNELLLNSISAAFAER